MEETLRGIMFLYFQLNKNHVMWVYAYIYICCNGNGSYFIHHPFWVDLFVGIAIRLMLDGSKSRSVIFSCQFKNVKFYQRHEGSDFAFVCISVCDIFSLPNWCEPQTINPLSLYFTVIKGDTSVVIFHTHFLIDLEEKLRREQLCQWRTNNRLQDEWTEEREDDVNSCLFCCRAEWWINQLASKQWSTSLLL